MSKKKTIEVQGLEIRIEPINDKDYVSLTDIARQSERSEPKYLIRSWLKNNNTIEFLVAWENLHNPNFIKGEHLHPFRTEMMKNGTLVTPQKWIKNTNAIGIISKAGRGGGTYAHKDIAINFCYWVSPTFQVYMIKAFQELLEERYNRQNLEFHIKKITDHIDEARNWLDTIEGQEPDRNRLNKPKK